MSESSESIDQQRSLVNAIAVIGSSCCLFLLIVLIAYFGWPRESNRFLFVGAIILFLSGIAFNKLKKPALAKFIVSYTPVIFSLAISIVNKRIGPIYINDYFLSRIAILAVSIIPILVFRYDRYFYLLFALLPSLLALIFFDFIHNQFGVGIFTTGYQDDTYFLTNYVLVMCYFGMNGFIYSIKRKNDIYFGQIIMNSQKLADQNSQLHALNNEVENKNHIITSQNRQLLEFSENLKNKVESRTKELTQLNQEMAEQNAKLEQFTYITAHNLKSPVAQIKGLLNLINYENSVPESTKSLIKKIDLSCLSLEEVIGDLNKILNIKNDSHIIERFNIAELTDQIIVNLKNEIKAKDIAINRRYHAVIEIDSIRAFIYSILFNLINNAVKFVDPEKEKSEIDISIEANGRMLEINIKDNGLGFNQEMAGDKVFQLYQRFNTNIQGKGLGLFLVKTQIEMINGKITVRSEEGVGTNFEISVPGNLIKT